MSIQTDSTPVEAPKDPDQCNVFAILKLLATPEETADFAEQYRKGGLGYGTVKKSVAELFDETLGPARERRAALAADTDRLEDILVDGAGRARKIAQAAMARVRDACGLSVGRATHAACTTQSAKGTQ
jgi:tryptophanyl-tRNA synthetase